MGPAAVETPAESAPDWHDPPDATEDAHPTIACAATFPKNSGVPNFGVPKARPSPKLAPAVAPAMKPDFKAMARLPLVTPLTKAADPNAAATAQNGAPGPHAATATIWIMVPIIGTERSRFTNPCQRPLKKWP